VFTNASRSRALVRSSPTKYDSTGPFVVAAFVLPTALSTAGIPDGAVASSTLRGTASTTSTATAAAATVSRREGSQRSSQSSPSAAASITHGKASEKWRMRTSPVEYTLYRASGTSNEPASSRSARLQRRRASSTRMPTSISASTSAPSMSHRSTKYVGHSSNRKRSGGVMRENAASCCALSAQSV